MKSPFLKSSREDSAVTDSVDRHRSGSLSSVADPVAMSSHRPATAFTELLQAARREQAPAVNVVIPVLQRIAVSQPVSIIPQERYVLWAAGASSLVAASLLVAVWTLSASLSDPAGGAFRPIEVAFAERM